MGDAACGPLYDLIAGRVKSFIIKCFDETAGEAKRAAPLSNLEVQPQGSLAVIPVMIASRT